eukprot:1648172-Amphidinium_carterae.1
MSNTARLETSVVQQDGDPRTLVREGTFTCCPIVACEAPLLGLGDAQVMSMASALQHDNVGATKCVSNVLPTSSLHHRANIKADSPPRQSHEG